MFSDFTSILKPGVVYYKDEAAFAKAGNYSVPAPKNDSQVTKTWGGRYMDPFISDNGNIRPGTLVFAKTGDGKTYAAVKVETQTQRIDHLSTDVSIIPFYAGRYFHPNQHRFYVRYKDDPNFRDGFPFFVDVEYSLDQEFLTRLNFSTKSDLVYDPPLYLPPTMAVRFKPGSGQKEIEVFNIEAYMKTFPPQEAGSKPNKTYKYSETELVTKVYEVLINPTLDSFQKGRQIRSLAEE